MTQDGAAVSIINGQPFSCEMLPGEIWSSTVGTSIDGLGRVAVSCYMFNGESYRTVGVYP